MNNGSIRSKLLERFGDFICDQTAWANVPEPALPGLLLEGIVQ